MTVIGGQEDTFPTAALSRIICIGPQSNEVHVGTAKSANVAGGDITHIQHVSVQEPSEPSALCKYLQLFTLPYYMHKLRKGLHHHAKVIHGKRDSPIPLQHSISLVELQLSTNICSSDLEGHYNKRSDFAKIYSTQQENIKLEDVFDEANKKANAEAASQGSSEAREQHICEHANKVALIGQAGIGKSTLSRKLVQLIIDKKMFPECKYLFYIQFRKVDFEPQISFLQLGLTGSDVSWKHVPWFDEEVLQKLGDGSKVAIIIDGLDEAGTTAFSISKPFPNPGGLATADIHIKHLLLGKLLPKAKKLITSRPRQFFELPSELRQLLVVKVLGLGKEAQIDLSNQICKDSAVFHKVCEFLNSNPDISSSCYVPALCILINHVLRKDIANNDSAIIQSLTDVFIRFLWYFAESGHVKGKLGELPKFAKLAFEGLKEGKILFTENDIKKSGIDQQSLQDFLTTSVSVKSNYHAHIIEGDKMTNFSHLTWQELFAAVHMVFFLSLSEFEDFCFKLVESKWEIVAKFCFGVLNKEVRKTVSALFNNEIEDGESKKQKLIDLVIKVTKEITSNDTVKLLMVSSWLHELHDDDVGRKVLRHLPKPITLQGDILPLDISGISYAFKLTEQPVKLHAIDESVTFVQKSWQIFLRLLKKSDIKIDLVDLSNENPNNEGWLDVISEWIQTIETVKPQINRLDLRGIHVGKSTASSIVSCLHHTDQILLTSYYISRDGFSQIEDVMLSDIISEEEVKCAVYQFDSELKEMKLGNAGSLAEVVLKIWYHEIDELDMQDCVLQVEQVELLARAITQSPQRIKLLDWRSVHVGKSVASSIVRCLHHTDQILLTSYRISLDGMYKAKVVKLSGTMTEKEIKLAIYQIDPEANNLVFNAIGLLLSKKLKKIELCTAGSLTDVIFKISWHQTNELEMQNCGLQAEHVKCLASVIKQSSYRIKFLDLSLNKIGNIGVKELVSCVENVEELRLFGCGITEVDHLCDKIRTLQQPLKILVLSYNKIGNNGTKELASCVENIDVLELCDCDITEIDDLCAKIETLRQPLKLLDLTENKIGNIGMKKLASCVENIEVLQLWYCGITEVSDLCVKIPTLKKPMEQLVLSGNEIGDDRAKMLCQSVYNIAELVLQHCGTSSTCKEEVRDKLREDGLSEDRIKF